MSARILKTLLAIFALMVSSACTKTIYKPMDVLVPTPVACTIPAPKCDHKKETDTEVITEARLCIKRYKEALSACRLEQN